MFVIFINSFFDSYFHSLNFGIIALSILICASFLKESYGCTPFLFFTQSSVCFFICKSVALQFQVVLIPKIYVFLNFRDGLPLHSQIYHTMRNRLCIVCLIFILKNFTHLSTYKYKTRGPWTTSHTCETVQINNTFVQSYDYFITLIKREKTFFYFLKLTGLYLFKIEPL